ncbi:PREDICTED: protein S100-A16 [Buceros rhinoceros silvestris]|uniref:protein S100-A16 n=1 Tax=Buceros rhinoceros silvestris TaxID=175836 RepID=UPI0005290833|nr:PREDICTED: protein S100-A16 [Buceros rhinoceros silvestris]
MAECTELEWAVQVLVNNFDKYSSRRCCCKKPRRISKKDLDENKDGRISCEEYWTLIGGIASPIAQIIRQQEQSVKHTK